MAQDQDYKLISINTAEDDDLVIQAGVVGATTPVSQQAEVDDAVELSADDATDAPGEDAADAEDAVDSAPAGASSAEQDADWERLDQAASEEDREEYLAHLRARKRRERAVEMITTEDDLHTKMPFSGMQKAIVIIMLALLVSAIVYWFFLR